MLLISVSEPMPKNSTEVASIAGMTLLAMSEVPNFMAGLLPSLMTIKRFAADERDAQALRRGEAIGGAMAVMVGVGASLASGSWFPFIGTMFTLAIFVSQYEAAIRNPHDNAVPINDPSNTNG